MRYRFILLLLFIATCLQAQQIEQAKDLLKAKKLSEAKAVADQMAKDAKFQKKSDAWYIIAKIYGAIAQDPAISIQVPNAYDLSFAALKKYVEYDDKMLIELQIDGYKPVNDIYTGFYQSAANSFNNKQYEKALNGFGKAIEVSTFMTEKKWINLQLDTNSVLYAGVSAEKLSRFDEAAKYYGLLAEGRVKGEGFVDIYKWVANYYFEQKNQAQAEKYLNLGREVYPGDPFWDSIELDMARNKA
ncbi:MAG TPA: hypothetical protein VHL77_11685, partial [Ferruginibacter sp.]|nr:hypothetical protein [Ferruginibacter sp.]